MGGPNTFANRPQPLPKRVGMDAHVNEIIRRAQERAAAANTSQSKDVGNLLKKNKNADASPSLENKSESK